MEINQYPMVEILVATAMMVTNQPTTKIEHCPMRAKTWNKTIKIRLPATLMNKWQQ
jgi:hypothetical protein